MKYRDGIFAIIALALTSVALAGVVYTDAYSLAAKTEATGVRALTAQLASGNQLACADAGDMLSAGDAATVRQ